ncbi:hypothetical protein [Aquimarina sp. AU119]|uniref:hypothetical protein n=1 Tax=Aquimarina sp. AU119 TaxID=2108528 RepID=UPI000D687A59|nr:hypothetical protein [Aquimarina sp. AU119]
MTTQMHLAAQYLAAAGISFLEKKDDDSHTNLGFSAEEGSMFTHPLNSEGDSLSLSYQNFSLDWNSNISKTSLKLDGTTHDEIVQWITQKAVEANIKQPFKYDLHYELPYPTITNDFTFKLTNVSRLRELTGFRVLAQLTLETFLENQQLQSDIRIWPHHFDIGAFASLKDKTGFAIGIGLAIPDTMIDDYYFYISAYKGHDGVNTLGLKTLTHGEWRNDGFKGAILPITGVDEITVSTFFDEAINAFKK